MYAVVQIGSRQFRVKAGDSITIDRVPGNAGEKLMLDKVLMIGGDSPKLGLPLVAGAKVEATIDNHGRGEKITIMKYKRRKNYKRTQGHRQPQSTLTINSILG